MRLRKEAGALLVLLLLAAGVAPAGADALSRRQANAIAVRVLNPPRDHGRVVIFGLPGPLGAGASVTEAGPGTRPRRSGQTLRRRGGRLFTSSRIRPLGRRAWLYWEDLAAGAEFVHPSRLLLIDDRTGRVLRLSPMQWYPLISGTVPRFLRTRAAYLSGRYRVFSNTPRPRRRAPPRASPFGRLAGAAATPALRPEQLAQDCLIVMGLREDQAFKGDIPAVKGWASYVGLRTFELPPNSGNEELSRQIDAATGPPFNCKDVMIYIAGHGYPAQPFRDPETGQDVPARDVPTIQVGKRITRAGGVETVADAEITGPELRNAIARHSPLVPQLPQAKFKLVIDSCFSGRWADYFRGDRNVQIVYTATNSKEYGWGFVDAGYAGRPSRTGVRNFFRWFGNAITNNTTNPTRAGGGTNGIVQGLYRWANSPADVQLTGGDLAKGIRRAAQLATGGDFTAQLQWTRPQVLDQIALAGQPPACTVTASVFQFDPTDAVVQTRCARPVKKLRMVVRSPRTITAVAPASNSSCGPCGGSAQMVAPNTAEWTGNFPAGSTTTLRFQNSPPPQAGQSIDGSATFDDNRSEGFVANVM